MIIINVIWYCNKRHLTLTISHIVVLFFQYYFNWYAIFVITDYFMCLFLNNNLRPVLIKLRSLVPRVRHRCFWETRGFFSHSIGSLHLHTHTHTSGFTAFLIWDVLIIVAYLPLSFITTTQLILIQRYLVWLIWLFYSNFDNRFINF
jgi:hypothetical protein